MNKSDILFLLIVFFLISSCENNKTKNEVTYDSLTSKVISKQEDSTKLNLTDLKLDSMIANRDTLSLLNGSNLKIDDYIKQYPANQKAELRSHIEYLREEWKNVPNPITAIYKGTDFGDYQHITFKDAKGKVYDFGQANNNLGQYKLYELSGQFEDNPEFLEKKFKVYWDWKLSEFLCCDGEYGNAIAYLPSITKLELIKN